MLLGEFLHALAKKAGLNENDEDLKNFIIADSLQKMEIPDTVVKGIDNNLISLQDAKNNHPIIKGHYQASALTPIDEFINTALEEYGIDGDMAAEIKNERSTYKKVPLLTKRIKELQEKKAASTDRGDKAAMQKQIDELQASLRSEKERITNAEKEFNAKVSEIKRNYHVSKMLGGYKTVYDNLDAEVRDNAIWALLNKELQDKNAKLTYDDGGNLVLRQKDDSNYYGDNNQLVGPQQFIESILSRNKLLVNTQTPPPVPGANGNNPTNGQKPNNPQGGQGSNSSSAALGEYLNKAKQDFVKSSAFS